MLPTVNSTPEPRVRKDPVLDAADVVYPTWWVPDDALLVESDLTIARNIMACLARRGHHIRWVASTQMVATLACVVRMPGVIFTDLDRGETSSFDANNSDFDAESVTTFQVTDASSDDDEE